MLHREFDAEYVKLAKCHAHRVVKVLEVLHYQVICVGTHKLMVIQDVMNLSSDAKLSNHH